MQFCFMSALLTTWQIIPANFVVFCRRSIFCHPSGSYTTKGRVLNDFWFDWGRDLSRAVDRLCLVGHQHALILLCASFSAPRVWHLLRCSPSVDAQGPENFDSLLRTALSQITNSTLSDSQWLQASLPIKSGGLGIRRISLLALPAFLASAASTLLLQDEILGGSRCYVSAVLAMALCPSVRLSQVGVLLKRLNVGSHKQHHMLAQGL